MAISFFGELARCIASIEYVKYPVEGILSNWMANCPVADRYIITTHPCHEMK